MRSPLTYSFIFLFPVLWVLGAYWGGLGHYLVLIVGYGLVPLLDQVVGPKPQDFAKADVTSLKRDRRYRWLLYAYGPIPLGLMVWAGFFIQGQPMAVYEWVGFILSSGVITGAIGMTVAHELCHSPQKLDGFWARTILVGVCYMHFVIEHVYGHHARVATPHDPATARFGESLYRFYFRSVFGGYRSAWSLERERLMKRRLAFWSHHNQMIWFLVVPVAFTAMMGWAFGGLAVAFFLVQAVVGFSYLEVINYVEHYGLERQQLANGRYEKVDPRHSWNSDHPVSNCLLFGLPTHSDHHARATKPYQILSTVEGAPQLPSSYPVMLPLAFITPLWRKVMDPLVAQARAL